VIKARLTSLCRHRGLDLGALPVHLITAPALRLDRADDQAPLRATVGAYTPRLLVLAAARGRTHAVLDCTEHAPSPSFLNCGGRIASRVSNGFVTQPGRSVVRFPER
jgi:hypothetical protein